MLFGGSISSSQFISTGNISGNGGSAGDPLDTGNTGAYQGGESGQSGYDMTFRGDYVLLDKLSESGDDYKISTEKVSGSGLKYNYR